VGAKLRSGLVLSDMICFFWELRDSLPESTFSVPEGLSSRNLRLLFCIVGPYNVQTTSDNSCPFQLPMFVVPLVSDEFLEVRIPECTFYLWWSHSSQSVSATRFGSAAGESLRVLGNHNHRGDKPHFRKNTIDKDLLGQMCETIFIFHSRSHTWIEHDF
jgi:hypothetical protein